MARANPFSLFQMFLFLITMASGLGAILSMANEWLQKGKRRAAGLMVFLLSLNLFSLFSFLSLKNYNTIFFFGSRAPVEGLLYILSFVSLFFTIPYMVNRFFPYLWSDRLLLFFAAETASLMFLNLSSIVTPVPGVSVGLFMALSIHIAYALIHGFYAILRIPGKVLHKSRDMMSFQFFLITSLIGIPFLLLSDGIAIPMKLIKARYSFLPFYTFFVNSGFLIIGMTYRNWADYEKIKHYLHAGKGHFHSRERISLHKKSEDFLNSLQLSPREKEVALVLLQKSSYKEIAGEMNISPATVKSHVINIYQKAGVSSREDFLKDVPGN